MDTVLRVVCNENYYIGYEPYSPVFSSQTSFPMVNGCLAGKWILLSNQASETVIFQFPGGLIVNPAGKGQIEVAVGSGESVPLMVLATTTEGWYGLSVILDREKMNPLTGQLYVGVTNLPELSQPTLTLSPNTSSAVNEDEVEVSVVKRDGTYRVNYAPLQEIQVSLASGPRMVVNGATKGGRIGVVNRTDVTLDFDFGFSVAESVPPSGQSQLHAPVGEDAEGLTLLRVSVVSASEIQVEVATGQLIILTQPTPDPDPDA